MRFLKMSIKLVIILLICVVLIESRPRNAKTIEIYNSRLGVIKKKSGVRNDSKKEFNKWGKKASAEFPSEEDHPPGVNLHDRVRHKIVTNFFTNNYPNDVYDFGQALVIRTSEERVGRFGKGVGQYAF